MRNVLLVTIDCLRADHVGCYGYDRPTTPAIDDLAAEGTAVPCRANAPGTRWAFKPIYMAAHALQIDNAGLPPSAGTTVVEALPDAYTTGCFAHNQFVSRMTNIDRGYDQFVGPDDLGSDRADAITVDHACEWLDSVSEPWFCHVHMMDAHAEWERRDDLLEAIRGDTDVPHVQRAHRYVTPGRAPPQKVLDAYDVGVRSADEQVGRLVDVAGDDTTAIVTADHGEEFGTFGEYHFAHLGPTMTNVPLVVRGMDLEQRLYQHLDIPYLILDTAGASRPESWDEWDDRNHGPPMFAALDEQVGCITESGRYIRDRVDGMEFFLGDVGDASVSKEFMRSFVDGMVDYCEDHKVGDGIDTSPNSLPDATVERLRDLGYLDDE